jgi:hypothetical protein
MPPEVVWEGPYTTAGGGGAKIWNSRRKSIL